MIEIEKVSKSFAEQKRAARFTALDRVSLSVAPGELLCLLGPSGCGKRQIPLLEGLFRVMPDHAPEACVVHVQLPGSRG